MPRDHTLYRDPATRRLGVMPRSALPTVYGDGQTCTVSGIGVVTPAGEAQRQRARNPFGADSR
jgi:hypothetical protein